MRRCAALRAQSTAGPSRLRATGAGSRVSCTVCSDWPGRGRRRSQWVVCWCCRLRARPARSPEGRPYARLVVSVRELHRAACCAPGLHSCDHRLAPGSAVSFLGVDTASLGPALNGYMRQHFGRDIFPNARASDLPHLLRGYRDRYRPDLPPPPVAAGNVLSLAEYRATR